MQKPKKPGNEDDRLKELLDYHILDTPPDASYDDITRLASSICNVPVAMISFVDKDRQWFKSKVGTDQVETHRDISFCGHAIHESEIFVVSDAKNDTRFLDNPLVESGFVRFYAGAPLLSGHGYPLGALCVIDQKPRSLTIDQIQALKALARQVSRNMELDRSLRLIKEKYTEIATLSKVVSKQKSDLIEAAKTSALGTLAAGLAHEVNNPLGIILGKCHRIRNLVEKDEGDKEKILEDVHAVEKNVARIALVTKGLETFSCVYERGDLSAFDAQGVIDQVLALCQERIKSSGIALHVAPVAALGLEGSAGQIIQVLINLINNAFDAVQGSEEKWIRLTAFERDGKVFFSVMDSGPGIPKENVHRIMEPFFTTKEVGKGMGLGLSLSKGIAEAHRGRLYLDPASHHTHFLLELPKSQSKREPGSSAA